MDGGAWWAELDTTEGTEQQQGTSLYLDIECAVILHKD